ncbi:hypothetical protein HDU92_001664 [Lobulomyces angularis]|nr:hypothetical protein HDU92_001664 [Lobulomyces angularis]
MEELFFSLYYTKSSDHSESVIRTELYQHYTDYCSENNFKPINVFAFGKKVTEIFPEIKVRRLGKRGDQKYHYAGLAKKTKLNNQSESSKQPKKLRTTEVNPVINAIDFSDVNVSGNQNSSVCNNSITQTKEHQILLDKYNIYCNKMVALVKALQFDEAINLIEEFYSGLKEVEQQLLKLPVINGALKKYDIQLVDILLNLLLPDLFLEYPIEFLSLIRNFTKNFMLALMNFLSDTHRLKVYNLFESQVRKSTNLNQTIQVSKKILKENNQILVSTFEQIQYTTHSSSTLDFLDDSGWILNCSKAYFKEIFEKIMLLLKNDSEVEDWLCFVEEKLLENILPNLV